MEDFKMMKLWTDLAGDMCIQDFLQMLSKFNLLVLDFNPEGPAGGNPLVSLVAKTKEDALGFLKELHPDDADEFLMQRITPL